ncbi:MAG: tetraacyldisaccharide 4'-kinase [Halothiobacillaceae bacterium]|nr:tetraacyldisaccharide 4'-kinase [Halothiobacillaceae bacterium]
MKAPSFWFKQLDWRSLALAPLAWLWCWLARRRVLAYRAGRRTAQRLPVVVIAIGNVTVGGTGKTPLTLWLAAQLRARGWTPAILSRGHGAKIKGEPRRVRLDSLAGEVGDEPLMLKRALPEVEVWVHPERFRAGQAALALGADVLLLDDGLQHLQLARDIEIAVVDAARGIGNGRCLPAGPLREPAQRLKEVDAVIMHGGESHATLRQWGMRLRPGAALNLVDGSRRELSDFVGQACDALAGIGHPERFFSMLRGLGLSVTTHDFAADHHVFTADELQSFNSRPLLMTAKDAVKCQPLAQAHQWHNHWCVPVEAELDDGFEAFIFSKLEALRNGQTTA